MNENELLQQLLAVAKRAEQSGMPQAKVIGIVAIFQTVLINTAVTVTTAPVRTLHIPGSLPPR